MIVAIVKYRIPKPFTLEKAREVFIDTSAERHYYTVSHLSGGEC